MRAVTQLGHVTSDLPELRRIAIDEGCGAVYDPFDPSSPDVRRRGKHDDRPPEDPEAPVRDS